MFPKPQHQFTLRTTIHTKDMKNLWDFGKDLSFNGGCFHIEIQGDHGELSARFFQRQVAIIPPKPMTGSTWPSLWNAAWRDPSSCMRARISCSSARVGP